MAISGPGFGAAAGTVGQLLMQHALQKQEREEREQARQQAMVPRMLQAFMGPGERAQPLDVGAPLPEGAREIPIAGQRFAAISSPPPTPEFTARATQPGGTIQGAFTTPEAAGEFTERFGIPEPPKPRAPVRGTPEYLSALEDELEVRNRLRPPPQSRDLTPTGAQRRAAAERDVGMMLTEGEFDVQDPAHRQVISKSLQGKYPRLRSEIPGMVSERVGEGAEDAERRARVLEAVRAVQGLSDYQAEPVLEPYGYRDKVALFADARRLGIPQSELTAGPRLRGPQTPGGTAAAPPAASPTEAPPTEAPAATEVPTPDEVAQARERVQAARSQGKDDAAIRQALRSVGFTDAQIAEILSG